MPDAAVAATERQFRQLLTAAAPDRPLDLVLFDMPGVVRDPAYRSRMQRRYQPVDAIRDAGLHALVVTGANPGDGSLRDAPFWNDFAALVDLAVELRLPTLWSCLAAHAAVEHLDGIKRQPLAAKYSGLYACEPNAADPMLTGLQRSWTIPHSRRNGLDEAELLAHGYDILTRSPDIGVDSFVRRGPPLFLFCQGHPEYDPNALALEYKRDLRAYLDGLSETAPAPPVGDFEAGADWRDFAVGLYANWLQAVQ